MSDELDNVLGDEEVETTPLSPEDVEEEGLDDVEEGEDDVAEMADDEEDEM